ncbi:YHS domain-containing (seleno)protein [Ekhidna sp. To15]|uniref:YHS domain-containing (seleno)protein n=1 Tax=Ekhidna sp. To15 TaxID=3395267 RepID=UPI003F5238D7
MKKTYIFIAMLFLMSACSSDAESPKDEVYNVGGVALDGYDPVAYYEQGEAKKGTEAESFNYNGLAYHFSSTKNRLLFMENPNKYLPNYGGWCAYAVAETSTKMKPDPAQWQIQDGELILFTSSMITKLTGSLKDEWNEDPEAFETRADSNWTEMNQVTP